MRIEGRVEGEDGGEPADVAGKVERFIRGQSCRKAPAFSVR